MAGDCAACGRYVGAAGLHFQACGAMCPVCGQPLRSYPREAYEGLHRTVRGWLNVAPVRDLESMQEERDPSDQTNRPYVSALGINEAVSTIADAVNKREVICPDGFATLPRNLRGDREFEYFRFVDVSPELPADHADVLLRYKHFYYSQWADPSVTAHLGSIYRVAAPRKKTSWSVTKIAVIWRPTVEHPTDHPSVDDPSTELSLTWPRVRRPWHGPRLP
jgi:hypothetical protein